MPANIDKDSGRNLLKTFSLIEFNLIFQVSQIKKLDERPSLSSKGPLFRFAEKIFRILKLLKLLKLILVTVNFNDILILFSTLLLTNKIPFPNIRVN